MLLSEWSTWTDAAVIADPENFLDNPDYLMSVLDSARDGSVRLLIIEDADALVERRSGRPGSVARLLNMTDGLLGASQDNFIIFTTNSPPNELDAALTRPGRCLATVYFEPFSVKDANQFLDGPRVTTPQTLAELYRARGDISQINVSGGELATGQYL
jgi:hypothetical protein